jgi:hypothetical protein
MRANLAVEPPQEESMPRPIATRALIAVELFLALLTMALTWSLLRDPSGQSVEFPANVLLVGTPFDDALVPALVLFVVSGALPLGVAIGSLMRAPWAPWGHLAVGGALSSWAIGQSLITGLATLNQLAFAAIGFGLIALAIIDFVAEKKAARLEAQSF